MFFRFGAWPCYALIAALSAFPAGAQGVKPALASLTLDAEPSLAVALEAACSLTARSRSRANRQAEINAREQAANSVLSGTPSQRSDRFQANRGLRNDEVGLAFPLWRVGVRAATVTQVDSNRAVLSAEDLSGKLKLAAELRELVTSAALNRLERDLAEHKHEDAQVLLQDTQRRVKSGERPRIDALQASAAERLAAVQLAQANAAQAVLQAQWHALTGLVQLSNPEESVVPLAAEHPRILAASARVRAAQTRLALTEVDKRDAPEVGVGLTRERALISEATQNALRLTLRIPFGGANRNAPRLSAVFMALMGLASGLAWAGEGHDHGHAAPASATNASPRVSSSSDLFELVGVVEHSEMVIYLDRFESNAPVLNAAIEVDMDGTKAMTKAQPDGTYRFNHAALSRPGSWPISFTVTAGSDADLLAGDLEVGNNIGPKDTAPKGARQLLRWVILAIITKQRLAQRRFRSVATTLIAVTVGLYWATALFDAYSGEGHSHDAAAQAATGNAPRRLPDGSVFLPKMSQRQLGIRTVVADVKSLPTTLELGGFPPRRQLKR